jgi:hypothetical protein
MLIVRYIKIHNELIANLLTIIFINTTDKIINNVSSKDISKQVVVKKRA